MLSSLVDHTGSKIVPCHVLLPTGSGLTTCLVGRKRICDVVVLVKLSWSLEFGTAYLQHTLSCGLQTCLLSATQKLGSCCSIASML